MNSNLASNQIPVFDGSIHDGLPGNEFFFSCLPHREALATLRYGIETRKGLILCTGDAGTGKSTLLNKLERELGSDITCLVISDPYLSFNEIVRRLLRSLHADSEADDEVASLGRCQELLRSQLATGRITAVAFDDAQHMRDDILEQILQNIIGMGASNRARNLAQVILTGRPEIKERLLQPPLRSFGSQIAVECRLQPLAEQEIADYIRQRLRAADLPEELFAHDALGCVANYSSGNFRQANALCDRALRMAQNSSRKQISTEIVDGAAKDLGLGQPRWVRKEDSKNAATTPSPISAPQDPPSGPRQRMSVPQEDSKSFSFQSAEDSRRLEEEGRGRLFIGSKYMVDYVRRRLSAADMPEELFERDALGRIASYSGDNFGHANMLCDRVLQTSQTSPRRQINSEIVDGAAKDVGLEQSGWVRKKNPKTTAATTQPSFSAPQDPPSARPRTMVRQEQGEPFTFPFGEREWAGKRFPKYSGAADSRRVRHRGGRHLFIGGLVILALVAIPRDWLDSEVVKHAIGALGNQLEKIAGIDRPQSLPTETSRITPYEPPSEPVSPSPLPGARAPAAMPDDSQNTLGPPTKVEEPVIPPVLPAPEPLRKNPAAEAKKAAPASHGFVRETATNDIETEVFMAIQNRAIGGVRVSISDNIVRLDGRVATERQRHAAEMAAASVPGVRAVRNRIAVD
ncbi:MAG TPA: AAA family ATPase [Verrucomicrobiae bacterium]|nr:AAA family ATPase [Verrucomicrobiae bacterium]